MSATWRLLPRIEVMMFCPEQLGITVTPTHIPIRGVVPSLPYDVTAEDSHRSGKYASVPVIAAGLPAHCPLNPGIENSQWPENDSSLNGDVSRGDNVGSLIFMKPKPVA